MITEIANGVHESAATPNKTAAQHLDEDDDGEYLFYEGLEGEDVTRISDIHLAQPPLNDSLEDSGQAETEAKVAAALS